MDEDTYFLIIFGLTLMYSLCFGMCAMRTRKLHKFSDDWKYTKIFYVTVSMQAFLRFATFSILVWAVPKDKVGDEFMTMFMSIPDVFFLVSYVLLVLQMVSVFYYTHMENDLQMSLLAHFTRPKHEKASKRLIFLMFLWLVVQGGVYALMFLFIMKEFYLELEVTLVNLVSATVVMLFVLYLHISYAGTPFKSTIAKSKLIKTTRVTIQWTIGRYIKGILSLYQLLRSDSIVSSMYEIHKSSLFEALVTAIILVISEIICYIVVFDYSFMGIFLFSEDETAHLVESLQESAATLENEVGSNQVEEISLQQTNFSDSSPIIDSQEITPSSLISKRKDGLGEIYKAQCRNNIVAYRVINFPRMSGYVLEEFEAEIYALKQFQSNYLVPFYKVSLGLPTIGIVMNYLPEGSLYRSLHEAESSFSNEQKVKIITEIAFGLRDLHSKNRVHGHLNSHNVLMDSGSPKIADLGLAKIKKYAGVVLGYCNKSAWSSPEILREACRTVVKPQTSDDVYSFGVVAWEVATELVPYNDSSLSNLQQKVGHEGMTLDVPEYVPSSLSKLLKACWHVEASKRPDIKQVCSMLDGVKWR